MRKILAAVLAVCMTVSVLAGCSKEEKELAPDVITEDTLWYNTTLTEIGKEYAEGRSDYRSAQYLGEFQGKYAYSIQDSVDDSPFAKVVLYDENGNVTDEASTMGGHFYYAMIVGDEIRVRNYNGNMVANFETGKIEYVDDTDYSSDWRTYLHSDLIDGYRFDSYFLNSTAVNTCIIEVYQGEEMIADLNMNDFFPTVDFTQVSHILKTEDGRYILISLDPDNFACYELDIAGGSAADVTSEFSWLRPLRYSRFKYTSSGLFAIDTSNIYKIDTSSGEYSKYLTTLNCDIPIFDEFLEIYDVADDTVILCTARGMFNSDVAVKQIYTLEKADKNPHAGKTVLKAASLSEDFFAGFDKCVTRFNSSQDDYFMTIDDRYFRNNFYPDAGGSDIEEIMDNFSDADTALGNKLSVDLKAGDGPDILFNGGDHLEFNNDECLTDLNTYLDAPDGINRDEYFDNVLRLAETDGKLYQIPLTFSMALIMTASDSIRDDQKGFTFDEYREFVRNDMNGRDVIMTGVWEDAHFRMSFMENVIGEVLGSLIDDGNADFDKDEFREIAEYAANDLQRSNDMEISRIANYVHTYSISYYLSYIADAGWDPADVKVLGVPGIEERGPGGVLNTTAAITRSCRSVEGCYSFLSFLLSAEGQETMMNGAIAKNIDGMNLIRKDSFDEYCSVQVDNYNAVCDRYASENPGSSAASLSRMGVPCIKADQDDIDGYRLICEGLSHRILSDQQITQIVDEEIQPYFEGGKSLDDCIQIINSRVQIVLDERT
ncbi:MAG: extracellular solute-binding protein [Clostridiales bacterium]|nr:extracellular solute-binding protein [Clostridiales bacterium]